jgi:Uma2 family endonuclease
MEAGTIMPVALTTIPEPPAPLSPPRKRWTRAECALMASAGVEDTDQLELIEGELISKMPKNRPHVNAAVYVMLWLIETFGGERVNPKAPIELATEDNPINEPVPDLIVLKRPSRTFRLAPPGPGELDLVVEISDASLVFDLTVKARLYARAGIAEYWVLDVTARRLIVHRDPSRDGYRAIVAYGESERVAPLAAPGRELPVADIFRS